VKRIVTKEFKRAGNRLALVGVMDAGALGGTVYADSRGQRGDRLFGMEAVDSIRAHWDTLLEFHKAGLYVSGSAIAEGGLALRLFESSHGSGLGARIDLVIPSLAFGEFSDRREYSGGRRISEARYDDPKIDSLLFGEFIGSALVEMSTADESEWQRRFTGYVRCTDIGEVTTEPRLVLADDGKVLWQEDIPSLAQTWSQTFREVVG
jgi:phosphoribosylformylglycinamidine (FGAM) synthase-like enzyme